MPGKQTWMSWRCRLVLANGEQGAEAGSGGRGREKEGMIKSKAQRQNKFQKANAGAVSRMTQVCAWLALSDCGVGLRAISSRFVIFMVWALFFPLSCLGTVPPGPRLSPVRQGGGVPVWGRAMQKAPFLLTGMGAEPGGRVHSPGWPCGAGGRGRLSASDSGAGCR